MGAERSADPREMATIARQPPSPANFAPPACFVFLMGIVLLLVVADMILKPFVGIC
jgi:hypothetical protein